MRAWFGLQSITLSLGEGVVTDSNADVVIAARVLQASAWPGVRRASLNCVGAVTNIATAGTVTLYDTVALAALATFTFTGSTALSAQSAPVVLPGTANLCELRINCNGVVGVDYFQLAMAELQLS